MGKEMTPPVSDPVPIARRLRHVPMRATTVRFGDALWMLLEREAAREGVSAAQFIRDATILRVAYAMGQRGDDQFDAALERSGAASPPADGAIRRRRALLDVGAAVRDPARLDALQETGLLDSEPAPEFDRLTRLASRVL